MRPSFELESLAKLMIDDRIEKARKMRLAKSVRHDPRLQSKTTGHAAMRDCRAQSC
jgi:hypothetical protein